MKNQLLFCVCLLSAASTVFAAAPEEPSKPRGQLLYENHCIQCHAGSVYARNPRQVNSLDDLYQTVEKWAKLQKLDWSELEIRDVANYLNDEYYNLQR